METRVGQLNVIYSARGNPTFTVDIWHDGLKKHRHIRGDSATVIQRKVQLQIDDWDEKWCRWSARREQQEDRQFNRLQQDERKAEAAERTAAAQEELKQVASILNATLSVDDRIDWERLKINSPFTEPRPAAHAEPKEPYPPRAPHEPRKLDFKYTPQLGLLDKLIPSRKKRIYDLSAALFESDFEHWKKTVREIEIAHQKAVKSHATEVQRLKLHHAGLVNAWEERRCNFLSAQAEANAAVDAKRAAYEAGQPDSILEYIDLVLSASKYPDCFPKEFDIEYLAESKTVAVNYLLPSPDDMPMLKAVKYVASRDDFEEQMISDSQAQRQYDDTLYKVVLRTVHELFESDVIGALDVAVVNGIVTATDRRTGKQVTSCILSLRVNRKEFMAINLAEVDPKACFVALKGIGSSKLHGLIPVPPIMPLQREDVRFVSSYEVANRIDSSVNLAAMGWEDFEHLIREIFEKEFSSNGGEVKVTQASRDGGVDAIAFDPDPIRGGKIVIQAKRYTNTVGVSAVRDLYGTVLSEGATKGVLVTTSDYGPDSYAFANGKPLVLLSGSNLLHMLQKHGHIAHIDLHEAKKLIAR
jgi:restriction system protein